LGTFRLHTVLNAGPLPKTMDATSEDFLVRQKAHEARRVEDLGHERATALLGAGLVVAGPLRTHGRLVGVLLVGAEQTDAPYAQEDLDLLTTLGEQAASATATVQLSERLAQSRAFEGFNRLSSFIIHDLKNSVSALSMLTQHARQHFDDPTFRVDALQTLTRTVERMQKLVGRLSARQAASELEFEGVPLDELVRDTVASIPLNPRLRLVLNLNPAPSVHGDTDAIQRVLQNLITNAVEAMEGEGTITLSTSRQDGMVACAVADTGCGMSEAFIRNSLFVPFQTTKKGGWGIGLYQAREIVTSHGARHLRLPPVAPARQPRPVAHRGFDPRSAPHRVRPRHARRRVAGRRAVRGETVAPARALRGRLVSHGRPGHPSGMGRHRLPGL